MTERIETPDNAVHLLREALEKVDALFEKASPRNAWDILCEAGDIIGDALSATAGKP